LQVLLLPHAAVMAAVQQETQGQEQQGAKLEVCKQAEANGMRD